MKAIIITHPGGPEVLQLAERPKPTCSENEVLINVKAAGINRPDVFQRKGNYPPPPGVTKDIPGMDIAGVIVEAGSMVSRWKAGDKVCALVSGGGYAEYCAAPEGQCLPIPEDLSFVDAASLPETFFTVWSNVFDRGQLKHGEYLLVHGGSSGIGVAAIQMTKALGNTVYVTVGSDEQMHILRGTRLPQKLSNYKSENFEEAIRRLTKDNGVNLILDMIGGDYTPGNIRSLADDGRLVLINTIKGKDAQVDLSLVMRKRLTITGSTFCGHGRDTAFKSTLLQGTWKNTFGPCWQKGK